MYTVHNRAGRDASMRSEGRQPPWPSNSRINAVGLPPFHLAAKDGADGFARPAASRRDKKVLLALVNCKERVSQLLDTDPIGSEIVSVRENLDVVNMTPDAALEEYGLMILKVKAVFNAVFRNRLVRAFRSVVLVSSFPASSTARTTM